MKRLQRYMQPNGRLTNFNLYEENFHVFVRARGGLRLSQLASSNFLNLTSIPHICFIQIGENDIAQSNSTSVARDLLSLAEYLHEGVGIPVVIVGQLLRRQPWASTRNFNEEIVATNLLLKEGCAGLQGVHFWHHRGFWSDLSFLCRDGVHLRCPPPSVHVVSSSPMHRYGRSIRSAILHFRKLLRPL